MKQTLLTLCLILFALPSWGGGDGGYCKKDNKPWPEEIHGVYFYCGSDIEDCKKVNESKYKKVFKSIFEHSTEHNGHDYIIVLPDTLTSMIEERVMIYGEIAWYTDTNSRFTSFQNTFNFKEFVCNKAKAKLCKHNGTMTSEFITSKIVEIQTDLDCIGYEPLNPSGYWKRVEK